MIDERHVQDAYDQSEEDGGHNLDLFIGYLIYLKCSSNPTISWFDIAECVHKYFDIVHSDSYFRKGYAADTEIIKAGVHAGRTWDEISGDRDKAPKILTDDEQLEKTEEKKGTALTQLQQLKVEKYKLADERTRLNASLRQYSKEERLKELAIDTAEIIAQTAPLIGTTKELSTFYRPTGSNEGQLIVGDWHYGMKIDNYYNKFDPDITKARVETLTKRVLAYVKKDNISTLNVINLNDLIGGRIHKQIVVESALNAVQEIMYATELLAEMLDRLSRVCNVNYYSCLDNHSRVEAMKSESIDAESFCYITDWWIPERLKGNDRVTMHLNEVSADIITYESLGFKIAAVHGNRDKIGAVGNTMNSFLKEHQDLVVMGHYHHFNIDENNDTIMVSNGSLMGMDTYAENLRKFSRPSQTLITTTKNNVAEDIHRILVG